MAIPESKLETWSHQGSVTQSSTTYNTIKNVLEAANTPYSDKSYSVFLQGSYGNDTNIYAESDVDIVIKLDDCFQSDLEALSQAEKDAFNALDNAKYTHIDFKRDVLNVLKDKYGGDIEAGDKAIAIAASGARRRVDVITAIQFRRYYKFKSIYDQSYDEGICFYNSSGIQIVNYPKQHSANLTSKHQSTNNWLKPMVRVIKNLRERLIDKGHITAGVVPSYYLECLLYNVPKEMLKTSFQDCFINTMNWIQKEADKSKLVCANEQYHLLWENSPTSWPKANCERFLNTAIRFWNNWQ